MPGVTGRRNGIGNGGTEGEREKGERAGGRLLRRQALTSALSVGLLVATLGAVATASASAVPGAAVPAPGAAGAGAADTWAENGVTAGPVRPLASIQQDKAYIARASKAALAMKAKYDIPASVAVAQSIQETGYGTSGAATVTHAYFGEKCSHPPNDPGSPNASGCHDWQTQEYKSGHMVTIHAYFRAYRNIDDSFLDYGWLTTTQPIYRNALPYRHDPDGFITKIGPHYATDPHYASEIIGLMRQWNLYSLDGQSVPPPDQPPPAAPVTVAYTGTTHVADGSAARLSATVRDTKGKAVSGRKVSFAIGSGAGAQTCSGTTDTSGSASCVIASVDQPLNDSATVPAAATFAGDSAYLKAATTATLRLEYVTGRGYGISATLPLLPPIGPSPDTGTVRTAGAATRDAGCGTDVNLLVLSANALCAKVVTTTGPSASTATSSVADADIGLPGLPVIRLSGVTATSRSTCDATSGGTDLTLSIGGVRVDVPDSPNVDVGIGLLGSGVKLVVNEQIPSGGPDPALTVDAVHLTAPGIDLVIASSTSAAHNCA